MAGQGRGSVHGKMRQQFLDTEIRDGGAEEHRRLFASEIVGHVEFGCTAAHQVDLIVESHSAVAQELASLAAV